MTSHKQRREAFALERVPAFLDVFGKELDTKGIINASVMLTVAMRTAMESEFEAVNESLKEAEEFRDKWWKVLCEASDALGGPTPEKAPFIPQHIAELLAERDEARAVAETMRKERGEDYPLPWDIDYIEGDDDN